MTGGCAIIETHVKPISLKSFLIVCFRYIGDVMVSTPLVQSIKAAYPDAVIDYLVFKGTEKGIIKNPLIRTIITLPKDSKNIGALFSLYRNYDMAFAATPSDRTIIAAAVAGKRSYGLAYKGHKELLRKLILNDYAYVDDRNHVVTAIGSLTELAGIPFVPCVTTDFDEEDALSARQLLPDANYILMHPYSMKECKYWPASHWAKLACLIEKHTDCVPIFTATPAAQDNVYLDEIMQNAPAGTRRLPCTLTQFAAALKGSAAYVGIDTAATHMSASLDMPTIALYGPSLTRYWAPWPNGCTEPSPFALNKGVQRVGKVTVVQKEWECVPCNRETCSISGRGKMECLEQMTPEEVFCELERALGLGR